MTEEGASVLCAICGRNGTVEMDPPRRTLARGEDPDDESFSITVILPDVPLCEEHAHSIEVRELTVGWCDDERCRAYGKSGELSPCGAPYRELKR